MKSILERDISGEPVSVDDPKYTEIKTIIERTKRLTQEMNTAVCGAARVREYFAPLPVRRWARISA